MINQHFPMPMVADLFFITVVGRIAIFPFVVRGVARGWPAQKRL